MTYSQRFFKKSKKLGAVVAFSLASCALGLSTITTSAKAYTGYRVYGPDGSSQYCRSYVSSGGSVFCS